MPTVEELKIAAGEATIDVEARVLGYAVLQAGFHASIDAAYEVDLRVGPCVYRVVARQFPTGAQVFQVKPQKVSRR